MKTHNSNWGPLFIVLPMLLLVVALNYVGNEYNKEAALLRDSITTEKDTATEDQGDITATPNDEP
jgi:hypothetical protein